MSTTNEEEGVVSHLRAMFLSWPGVKECKHWDLPAFSREGKPFLLGKDNSFVLNCLHQERFDLAVARHQGSAFSCKGKVRKFWCEIPATSSNDVRLTLYLIREVTDSL